MNMNFIRWTNVYGLYLISNHSLLVTNIPTENIQTEKIKTVRYLGHFDAKTRPGQIRGKTQVNNFQFALKMFQGESLKKIKKKEKYVGPLSRLEYISLGNIQHKPNNIFYC